jgi:Cu(I)/Ag(I) efflux system membrane fusion protein
MFVHAVVRSKISLAGKVMDPELAGKWLCSMHPEVVKDRPGRCDECGMPLVKAESLGFVAAPEENAASPMVIPASAPLITGARAVVYVAVKDKEGIFEGREIVLGPRTGDFYIVKEGLEPGEEVVVNGAFKIDSDLQIQAKPSMMSPETTETDKETEKSGEMASVKEKEEKLPDFDKSTVPAAFKKSADDVLKSYFEIQYALSSDDFDTAKSASEKLLKSLSAADMKLLNGSAHQAWMKLEKKIGVSAKALAVAGDIGMARVHLEAVTAPVEAVVMSFGTGETGAFRIHCPMAFNNKGAYWLQADDDTRNPYYGASMLKCQDSIEPILNRK